TQEQLKGEFLNAPRRTWVLLFFSSSPGTVFPHLLLKFLKLILTFLYRFDKFRYWILKFLHTRKLNEQYRDQ
ncbi:MAG: hypothetical protein EDM75_03580, partial [Chlorobiota bacterium]